MKNIKDITLLAFAIVGFYTIITAFTSTESNQPQQVVNGTPESYVWDVLTDGEDSYMWNKITGDVRILSGTPPSTKGGYITLRSVQK